MTPPLVSIILPAYNHERYVIKTLDSVFAQEYPLKEFIIIDDGSTDDTAKVIGEWVKLHNDKLDITFKSRENRGVSATLNELLSMASGQYIAGASSDDYLLPKSIEVRLDYLLANPDKKAVFGDCRVIDENGSTLYESGVEELYGGKKGKFFDSESLKQEILYRFSVAGPVLMFDNSIFDLIGLYDESLVIEDWDMYLRMACHELLGFVDEQVASYRWHDECSCRKIPKDIASIQYEMKIISEHRPYFQKADQMKIDRRMKKLKRRAARQKLSAWFSLHSRG